MSEDAQRTDARACEVCGERPPKYCCPRCQLRSCSLECIQAHKAKSGCTGKRDRTAFVGRSQLDENALLSDYWFLEEVQLAEDIASRHRPAGPSSKPSGSQERFLPRHLQSLVFQAERRGVRLHIQPQGMQLRKVNSTRYDPKKRTMAWRVEWKFPGFEQTILADPRVSDTAPLRELLAQHAEKGELPWQNESGPDAMPTSDILNDLRVLLRKHGTPANAPEYFMVDPEKSLQDILSGKEVVEFPTFLVLRGDDKLSDYVFVDGSFNDNGSTKSCAGSSGKDCAVDS